MRDEKRQIEPGKIYDSMRFARRGQKTGSRRKIRPEFLRTGWVG